MKRKHPSKGSNKKLLVSLLLFVAGICFCASPSLCTAYQDYRQQEMLLKWKEGISLVEALPDNNNFLSAQTEIVRDEVTAPVIEEGEREIIGVLQIDAIELTQPIIKGASYNNLRYSVSTMEPTGTPGEAGNFVVLGHNSRNYGRHFNRLEEMQQGDTISVILKDQTVNYQVDNIQIIEDTDMWIAESDGDTERITLITCYYAEDGTTKRLAVQGTKF